MESTLGKKRFNQSKKKFSKISSVKNHSKVQHDNTFGKMKNSKVTLSKELNNLDEILNDDTFDESLIIEEYKRQRRKELEEMIKKIY